MDIVYPVKATYFRRFLPELRFSLRSLKNIDHGKVWIFGMKPDWVTGVEHIAMKDNLPSRQLNVINKLRAMAEQNNLSENFIFMNDDFLILKRITGIPYYYRGSISGYINRLIRRDPRSGYLATALQTRELLRNAGINNPLNFSVHTPIILNKTRIKELLSRFDFGRGVHFRSIYGNYFGVDAINIGKDVKIKESKYFNRFLGGDFISLDDGLMHDIVIHKLEKMFPDSCQYEKTRL